MTEYAIFADAPGGLLPLGVLNGPDDEPEADTIDRALADADPLAASLYDADDRTYDGWPIVRRAVARGAAPDGDVPEDSVVLA